MTDLHQLLLVKFCFFVFVLFGVVAVYRRWPPSVFLFGFGALSAGAYFFLIHGTTLMFWGLTADEVTIAAMYEMFAHGSLFSDFAYSALPPFYPALWFQGFGFVGRLVDWNGVQMAKVASLTTLALFPVAFYGLQRWYARYSTAIGGVFASLCGAILIFVVSDWDAVIIKPYELVSASLVILWTTFLVIDIHHNGMTRWKFFLYGLSGGLLFLLFYFWFFLAAIGVALFHLFSRPSTKMYLQFAVIGLTILAIGSVYWIPLIRAYHLYGAENWQLGFFVKDWIATHGPELLSFSIKGAISLTGLVSLICLRKSTYIRSLLSLFVAGYAWQLMGIITLLFFSSPLQESKGFFFWNRTILALGAAYGLEQVYQWMVQKYHITVFHKQTAGIVGIVLLAPALLFSSFADAPEVQAIRSRAMTHRPGVESLISYLRGQENFSSRQVLTSGIPELHAFIPLKTFLYFNQHNSHPAARFSERLRYIRELTLQTDPAEFARMTQETPFGSIEAFIFYKGVPDKYPVYVVLDNFPNGIREERVDLPRSLFDAQYFDTVYDNGDFVVIVPK